MSDRRFLPLCRPLKQSDQINSGLAVWFVHLLNQHTHIRGIVLDVNVKPV